MRDGACRGDVGLRGEKPPFVVWNSKGSGEPIRVRYFLVRRGCNEGTRSAGSESYSKVPEDQSYLGDGRRWESEEEQRVGKRGKRTRISRFTRLFRGNCFAVLSVLVFKKKGGAVKQRRRKEWVKCCLWALKLF